MDEEHHERQKDALSDYGEKREGEAGHETAPPDQDRKG
jgi:hypothetical protein